MAGTVNISRDLWDDPTFKDSEMSQREAWIWMIAEASWKAREKRVGTVEIKLQRGQLAVSSRFMAKAWLWSEPRVRRYLEMLENRRMITRVTDAGITVITICKYDDYQNAPRVGDAPTTQEATQDRRTTDANYNKGEIRGNKDLSSSSIARGADDASPDWNQDRLWHELISAVGVDQGRLPTHWMPPAAMIHAWRWVTDWNIPPESVVDAARQSRKRHDSPPDGPRALDSAMKSLARELEAGKLPPLSSPQALSATPSNRDARPGGHGIVAQIPEKYRQ